ncbi:tyrosine recombinase XerC [Pseudomonadota bacterium]
MSNSVLKLRYMEGLKYGGKSHVFSYVVNRETGKPIHEICGFAFISAITGKHKTRDSSKSIIQQLKQFWEDVVLYNDIDWRGLSDEAILQYLYEYRYLEQDCKGPTIDLQRTAIQTFYDWAYKYGFIEHPMELDIGFDIEGFKDAVDQPDPHTVIQSQYITDKEFKKLLANVRGESDYIRIRNEIALLLGKESGTRTHELTSPYNFNVSALLDAIQKAESENKTAFDFTIYGKGNGKSRKIEISTKVFIKLKRFLRDKKLRGKFSSDLPLFLDENGKPIISSGFGTSVFKDAKDTTLEFTGKIWEKRTYHSLRHTYATNLATWCSENGMDWRTVLPSRLGHSHWETSQIYVEVDALIHNRSDILNQLKVNIPLRSYKRGE